MTIIIGIKLNNKEANAVELQQILTDFGCDIKLRLGINNGSFLCSKSGIILLQLENKESAIRLENALININGIELERMIF